MSKRIRQYLGIVIAIICYYIVHEGAHYLVAFFMGTFKQIIFMGLGVQVDVFRENMTDFQLGIFCLAGALATLAIAVVLIFAAPCICKAVSKVFRACLYYITIVFLFLDPLYLSVLCGFFGLGRVIRAFFRACQPDAGCRKSVSDTRSRRIYRAVFSCRRQVRSRLRG